MLVSGLVLHLAGDPGHDAAALDEIRAIPNLELGAGADARRLPAVLEAASEESSKETIRALEALAGIHHVEVAFVGLDPSWTEN